jgi:hypothetical protein
MRIAERMFLKMKEDEAKNKIEEEEKTKRRIHLFTNHKVRLSNPLLIYALSLMGVTVKAKVRMRMNMKVIVKMRMIFKNSSLN